jgi:hypothetical protein
MEQDLPTGSGKNIKSVAVKLENITIIALEMRKNMRIAFIDLRIASKIGQNISDSLVDVE